MIPQKYTRLVFKLILAVIAIILLLRLNERIKNKDENDQSFDDLKRLMLEAEEENWSRLLRIEKVCKRYNLGMYENPDKSVRYKVPPAPQYSIFYFDRVHNISYCPIYKAGSTTWLYNLCILNNVPEEEINDGKEQISSISRRVMPELEYPEADEVLGKSGKLLVVRHPFERLLSAYRDKLENSTVRQEHEEKSSRVEPTWREFVNYLIDSDLVKADDHWIPYYYYCTPCSVKYDIVAKVETLKRDQIFAIEKLKLRGKLQPKWRHGNSLSGASKIYFRQLSKKMVHDLFDKFKLDFELFDYSPDLYYQYADSDH
ncbi:carbohydrate sulfotransferase 11-like isoform X2 [Prorops nasuta]|uniref:carbohydrate sulfotransferase 11-like isoform X2 n=1 Tax=Prorops nasuta TaxID=863751 RepID=UPI0034CD6575